MPVRSFSFLVGIIYSALGFLGLTSILVEPVSDIPEIMAQVGVTEGFGYILGLFPTNAFGGLVYMVIGLAGLAGSRAPVGAARIFVDFFAVGLGLFSLLGIIPVANTLFGLMPIFGNDVWLHLATAIPAAYFGFAQDKGAPGEAPVKPREQREPYYQ
ncbi:MAG: DUF4383 domain-containing protein [Phormidesmis sp.]